MNNFFLLHLSQESQASKKCVVNSPTEYIKKKKFQTKTLEENIKIYFISEDIKI